MRNLISMERRRLWPRTAWPFSGRSRKVSVPFAQTLRHCVNIANASAPRISKEEIFFSFFERNASKLDISSPLKNSADTNWMGLGQNICRLEIFRYS